MPDGLPDLKTTRVTPLALEEAHNAKPAQRVGIRKSQDSGEKPE